MAVSFVATAVMPVCVLAIGVLLGGVMAWSERSPAHASARRAIAPESVGVALWFSWWGAWWGIAFVSVLFGAFLSSIHANVGAGLVDVATMRPWAAASLVLQIAYLFSANLIMGLLGALARIHRWSLGAQIACMALPWLSWAPLNAILPAQRFGEPVDFYVVSTLEPHVVSALCWFIPVAYGVGAWLARNVDREEVESASTWDLTWDASCLLIHLMGWLVIPILGLTLLSAEFPIALIVDLTGATKFMPNPPHVMQSALHWPILAAFAVVCCLAGVGVLRWSRAALRVDEA